MASKKVHYRINTRMPQGDLPDPCPKCLGKVAGSQSSKKYRREVTFVHAYSDKACTKWLRTTVYHADCWDGVEVVRERSLVSA